MRAIRTQYLLAFAVMGSLLPYLPLFLRQRGLDDQRIGQVIGMMGVAMALTPELVALLADTRYSSRALLAAVYALGGLSLGAMLGAHSFVMLLLVFSGFAIAFAPVHALHDGLTFSEVERRALRGLGSPPYHRVRVFGTVGFILPSLLLYAALRAGAPVDAALMAAIGFCVLGLLNAFRLPNPAAVQKDPSRKLPTLDALRTLARPRLLAYCAGMFLLVMSSSAYYAFYPRYLTDEAVVGIDMRWVGLISSIGVSIEIVFMLGFARLVDRLTLRGLITLGVVAMIVRLLLLGLWVHPAVAVGTQVFHGIQVMVMHVAPPMLLNRAAAPGYRSSMQGVYAMGVNGVGRVIGSVLAGLVAGVSLTVLFVAAGALATLALPLLAWAVPGDRAIGTPPTEAASAKPAAR